MNKPAKDDVSALILAAGSGERLGKASKAFLDYHGVTLLEHVCALVSKRCGTVWVGVADTDLERAESILDKHGVTVLTCGATRQDTVGILLDHATQSSVDIVIVHEVARPFASDNLLARVLDAAANFDAVAPVIAVRDRGPKKNRDGIVTMIDGLLKVSGETDSRVALQTPQGFRRDCLVQAHHKAEENDWQEGSSATLVHRAGIDVKLIDGEAANIKLTYPEDLDLLNT